MSICNRTPTSTEHAAQIIAEAMARFTGQIEVVPGLPETPPIKKRTDWIDPESKFVRKKNKIDMRRVMTPEKLAQIRAAQQKQQEMRKAPDAPPSMAEMARRYGLHKSLVWRRVRQQGMTIEQAVTTPVNDRNQRFRR